MISSCSCRAATEARFFLSLATPNQLAKKWNTRIAGWHWVFLLELTHNAKANIEWTEEKSNWKMAQPFIMLSSERVWWIDFLCRHFWAFWIEGSMTMKFKCEIIDMMNANKRIHISHATRWDSEKRFVVNVTIIQIEIFSPHTHIHNTQHIGHGTTSHLNGWSQ